MDKKEVRVFKYENVKLTHYKHECASSSTSKYALLSDFVSRSICVNYAEGYTSMHCYVHFYKSEIFGSLITF